MTFNNLFGHTYLLFLKLCLYDYSIYINLYQNRLINECVRSNVARMQEVFLCDVEKLNIYIFLYPIVIFSLLQTIEFTYYLISDMN